MTCSRRLWPPQPTAMTREIKLGIQVQRSQKWTALKPRRATARATRHVMMMPTLGLTLAGLSAEMVCPPTTADRRQKPVTVAALSRRGIVTRYLLW